MGYSEYVNNCLRFLDLNWVMSAYKYPTTTDSVIELTPHCPYCHCPHCSANSRE